MNWFHVHAADQGVPRPPEGLTAEVEGLGEIVVDVAYGGNFYAIVEPHELPDWPDLGVWHFDFYRFGDPREWEDAGFRDLFASPGLKLVEWPDKAAGLLPQPDLALTLDLQTDGRRQVTWQAASPDGRQLLDALGPMAHR